MHHRDHLRLAFELARLYDEQRTLDLFRAHIQDWAARNGYAALYNEQMTRYWVHQVVQAMQQHPELSDFDAFLQACPELLDKQLYSPREHA